MRSPDPELLQHIGTAFAAARYEDAVAIAEQMIERYPDHGIGWQALGTALCQLGQDRKALEPLSRAAELMPLAPDVLSNLASTFKTVGRPEEAERFYRRALALAPTLAEVETNLGNTLQELGRPEEAEQCHRHALALKPGLAPAYINLGNTLQELGRLDEAEQCHRRALELAPGDGRVRASLGMLLLAQQRYREGWPLLDDGLEQSYERTSLLTRLQVAGRPWRGEALAGKSLLLCPEQGYGDTLQFMRYVPRLKERGVSRLSVLCQPALTALLASVPEIDQVESTASALPPHDYRSFALSAARYEDTQLDTIPARLPYLYATPERIGRWQPVLGGAGPKIGLVWRGNLRPNASRSLPDLATLAPLWSIPGLRFFSLQKERGEREATYDPERQPLQDLAPLIEDFADTAAILAQIDLLITIDTAIAHLAGALGRPVWVLLPAVGVDWRWQASRSDSPWYPGVMRLFRQARPRDWANTVAEVGAALEQWAQGHSGLVARQSSPFHESPLASRGWRSR